MKPRWLILLTLLGGLAAFGYFQFVGLEQARHRVRWLEGWAAPWLLASQDAIWRIGSHRGWVDEPLLRPGPRLLRLAPWLRDIEISGGRLTVTDFRTLADGTPDRLEARWRGARIRFAGIDPDAPIVLPAPIRGIRPIPPGALGYTEAPLQLGLSMRFLPDTRALRLSLDGAIDGLGRWSLHAELDTDARIFGAIPDDLGLRSGSLSWHDDGLMDRYHQLIASQKRIGGPAARAEAAALFARYEQDIDLQWDAESSRAMRGFLSCGGGIAAKVFPLADIPLRDYELYAERDWPRLLALQVRPAAADD